MEQTVQALAEQTQTLRAEEHDARQIFHAAQQTRIHAETQAHDALEALPDLYRRHITPFPHIDIALCFQGEYPTDEDLKVLSKQSNRYEQMQRQLQELREQAGERETLRTQHEPVLQRLHQCEAQYPSERVQDIRQTYHTATQALEEANHQWERLHILLQKAEAEFQEAARAVTESETKYRKALSQGEAQTVRQQEVQRIITHMVSELPPAWQEMAVSLRGEQLAAWQTEMVLLDGAEQRRDKLATARRQHVDYTQRLHRIQQEIHDIPPEAQCSLAMLEETERDIRQKRDSADGARRQAELAHQALKMRHQQRQDLETASREAMGHTQLSHQLARLLNRDNLQRYLLQQAEAGIVEHANEVLDRISGGILRLELRQTEASLDSDSSAKISTKAFDLIAYNVETSEQPLPVDLLSGSQRFRAAVSLALGIGQYVGQGMRPIESVIIDEGFGSLDKEGRHAIIDEFHALKDVLSRIILVSHQEEFASAFTNGYEIRIEDGTSRASLLGS